jgi:general secretion pathway protein D
MTGTTMKMKIEVSTIGAPVDLGGLSQPIILNNSAEETIRLKRGESSIIGGILDREDSHSRTGVPGLAEVPILKYIFGADDHIVKDNELVFLVTPTRDTRDSNQSG